MNEQQIYFLMLQNISTTRFCYLRHMMVPSVLAAIKAVTATTLDKSGLAFFIIPGNWQLGWRGRTASEFASFTRICCLSNHLPLSRRLIFHKVMVVFICSCLIIKTSPLAKLNYAFNHDSKLQRK